jgi:protein O-mannosyl-transferase
MNEPELTNVANPPWAARRGIAWAGLAAHPAFVCLVLAAVTFAVFWPVSRCEFLNYDDPDYVTANVHVQQGLAWDSVIWAFGTAHAANWHPLTWLSHMLDVEWFGHGATGPHVMNLLFHTANVLLLFLVLRRLTGAHGRSALVAALFALHPLHVESVAWVAERKDLLSTLFWLLTMGAYGRYTEFKTQNSEFKMGRALWYGAALVLFVLGLMSKPMVVTLPFVLLLLDWWPLQRIPGFGIGVTRSDGAVAGPAVAASLGRLVEEKIPFFVLSAVSCVLTFVVQQKSGALIPLDNLPFGARLENAFVSYARYLGKLFWPVDLVVLYPHPGHWPGPAVVLAVVLVIGLSAAAVWFGRRWPFAVTGWFWFLGTLVPVIGLVQMGIQSFSDRYTYIPGIGVFIAVTWGAAALFVRRRRSPILAGGLALLMLCACAARTVAQLRHWQNSGTLFQHALAWTTRNFLAHDNLGNYLLTQGREAEAIEHFRAALQISPNDVLAYDSLGTYCLGKGRLEQAMENYRRALELDPRCGHAWLGLGHVRYNQKQYGEAIACYQAALRLEPDAPEVFNFLGGAFLKNKQFSEAIRCYQAAVRLRPDDPDARNNLGAAWFEVGRDEEAVRQYAEALRLAPNDARVRVNLANVLLVQGRVDEAIDRYRQALQINPNLAEALNNLGLALASRGEHAEAMACYRRALQWTPDDASLHCNFGKVLAQTGRDEEAIRQYTEALRLEPDRAEAHLGLGRALLRLGRREDAVARLQETLRLNPDCAEAKRELQALGAATGE